MGNSRFRPLTIVVVLLAAAMVGPAPASAQDTGSWTVLVYLDAEGNLEESGMDNMLEMEALGSGPTSRILVQMDRGEEYDTRDGDWEGTRRYEIPRDATDTGDGEKLASTLVADMGEVNMGDPATLADFLEWGVKTAPADHYMVILWDHGGAWNGLAWDHTPVEDFLSLKELGQGLDDGRKRAGIERWDIVYFDACVMGAIEVTHAVGDTATLVIASEELVPGQGGSYTAMMEALRESPGVSPEEMAGRLTSSFAARYAGAKGSGPGGHECKGGCGTPTYDDAYLALNDDSAVLSWYIMSKEPALWSAWMEFNAAIKTHAAAEWPLLVRAARAADRFTYEDAKSPNAMDVGDFAKRVRDGTAQDGLRDAASAVVTAVNDFVGGYTTSPSHKGATGVMAKFPVPSGGPPAGQPVAGAGATGATPTEERPDVYASDPEYAGAGDGFAALAQAAAEGDDEPPTFGEISVVPGDGTVEIRVVVNDPNAAAVDVAITDETSEYGEVLAWIPPTRIDETEEGIVASFTWDGNVLILVGAETEDGDPIIAPAFFESLESTEYMLEGQYRVGSKGKEQDALLRFDLDGKLKSAWIVGDLASEVRPRVGDAFAILSMGWEDGEPISLLDAWVPAAANGKSAWHLEAVPLSGGATGFAAYAEDLSGNAALSDAFIVDLPEPADDGDTDTDAGDPTDDGSDDADADDDVDSGTGGKDPAGTDADGKAAAAGVGDEETPAAPLGLALAAIAGVAVAMRRRRA